VIIRPVAPGLRLRPSRTADGPHFHTLHPLLCGIHLCPLPPPTHLPPQAAPAPSCAPDQSYTYAARLGGGGDELVDVQEAAQGTYGGKVVDGSGEALGIASDLVHEGHVGSRSKELDGAVDDVQAHLGRRGGGAAGNSGTALEAKAGHARGGEGSGRSHRGSKSAQPQECHLSDNRVSLVHPKNGEESRQTRFFFNDIFFPVPPLGMFVWPAVTGQSRRLTDRDGIPSRGPASAAPDDAAGGLRRRVRLRSGEASGLPGLGHGRLPSGRGRRS
jgi:hypothetical protein